MPATMKQMMMKNSSTLADVVPTMFIAVASILLNSHSRPPTPAERPPSVSSSTGERRLMRCTSPVTTMPQRVLKNVASNMGRNMSVGCAAPICARYTMILTGMMVSPLVLSTRNIIMELEAVSFFVFNSCSPSIAFRPSGVAALSRPSMLAERFMKMLPMTGWLRGISGNSFANTGPSTRARAFTTPPRSPIFMMPIHSESTPVSPSEISNAVLAESNVELMTAGNTS